MSGFEVIEHFVFWCSLIGVLLPPLEWFNRTFDCCPKAQKAYAAVVELISNYGAMNFRGRIAAAYNRRVDASNGDSAK